MFIPKSPFVFNAPALPGLIFRFFKSPDDYAAMTAVRSESAQHDRVDPHSSREGIPTEADIRGMGDEATLRDNPDLLLVAINNHVIGYNHIFWRWTEVTGLRVYLHLGYLLPAYRGKGIGSVMLEWAQRRIRDLAAEEHADERATFATNVSSTELEADTLMLHSGYAAVRRLSDMVLAPLPPTTINALPYGVDTRPVEPAQYRAIYAAMKDAYQEMWISTPASEADYESFLEENVATAAFDPTLWQVAWSGDSVVGVVISRISNGVGHIAEVEVRRAWQRRGIGRALIQAALHQLRQRGIDTVRLYTDADNGQGARGLYESLDFREVKQHIFYRRLLFAL